MNAEQLTKAFKVLVLRLTLTLFSVNQILQSDDDSDDDVVSWSDINQVTFNIPGQPGQTTATSDDDADTLVGSTMGAVNPRLNDSLDDTLVGSTMGDVNPTSGNFSSFNISAELRALLPDNWDQGKDGLGAVNSARAKNTMFRRPWEFSPESIRSMTRH